MNTSQHNVNNTISKAIKIAMFDAKEYDRESFEAEIARRAEIVNSKNKKTGKADKTSETGDHPNFKIQYFDTRLTASTAPLAKGADVVCAFVNDQVDASVIDILYNAGVKILAMRCAGYNNVDIEYAYKKLHIVRVPAYSPYAVAEHSMAMLLTSLRRIHKAYNRTRDFNFSLTGMTGEELHGKIVGVVGTGKIGRVFIDICRGFGMKIVAYDKFPAEDLRVSGVEFIELDELMRVADVISLHCPLTDENHHMINEHTIELMKSGVIIINTSRGALIDANALLDGIKSRKIGAACLDVYEEESDIFFQDFSTHIVDDDILARLISMPNVIITSHQAYLTHEALENIAEATLDNIEEMLANGMSENEICYKCPQFENCNRNEIKKCF